MTPTKTPIVDAWSFGVNRPVIVVRLRDGRRMVHRQRFGRDDWRLPPLLLKIRAAGAVDLAHWRRPNRYEERAI